jgi:sugar/nucleoside kinase (ribokinase family)
LTEQRENEGRLSCLAVGHITHDRYGDDLAVGGSVLYAAKTLGGLGADVGIATAVGQNFAFKSEVDAFDLMIQTSKETTTFENTYPKDGPRLMLVEHPADDVRPTCLEPGWQAPDILFLAPVIGEVPLKEWLEGTRARIVGLGLQGFLKQKGKTYREGKPGHAVKPKPFDLSEALAQKVSAVFLSQEDLDGYDDKSLLDKLTSRVPIVAVTLGEEGARIHLKDKTLKVGVRNTNAPDPTGAGDTFAAAFLFAVAKGAPPKEAAKLAAAAASIVVEATGPAALNRVKRAFGLKHEIPVTT